MEKWGRRSKGEGMRDQRSKGGGMKDRKSTEGGMRNSQQSPVPSVRPNYGQGWELSLYFFCSRSRVSDDKYGRCHSVD